MINATSLILLVSSTVLLGYIGSLLYSKTNIPDLVWLLMLGIIVGPILKVYDPEPFKQLSSLMSTIALAIILFEAGINMNVKQIIQELPKSIVLMSFTFSLSVISIGSVLHLVLPNDFSLMQGLLLGVMVGGTSTVTTVSILSAIEKSMKIQNMKVILTLESVLTDPLCIVTAITLIQMITSPSISIIQGIKDILFSFSVSIALGFGSGIIWTVILDRLYGKKLNYMITIAVMFITYLISEQIGLGSGPVTALLFGLILTNSNSIIEKLGQKYVARIDEDGLRNFHEEVTFFIKSFFFVYIGLIVTISLNFLIIGLVLTMLLTAIRFLAASLTGSIMKFTKEELVLSRMIFANGLPALIMSQLPAIYDPNKHFFLNPENYPNITIIIVLGTVLYGAVIGPYLAKKHLQNVNTK